MKRSKVRLFLAISLAPMPNAFKRPALGWLLGAHIDKSAKIGLSILDTDALEMGPGSRIGHFTVFRGLRRMRLGPAADIGNFNWISASPMFQPQATQTSEHGGFTLGRESAITSRHYIDCSGGVVIGEYATVAGVRSTILSHEIDLAEGVQTAATTRIGDYCFVSSNVCVTSGSNVPDRSVVAMGAVVVGDLAPAGALFGGVPARMLRSSVDSGGYFRRRRGFVDLTKSDRSANDPNDRDGGAEL